jgi:two-component system OmpR family sensor kinase
MPADSSLPSIRRRLLWRAIGLVLLATAISATAAALAVTAVVREVMESALEETAQALIVLAEHESEVEALSHDRALPAPVHAEAILWQLRAPSGRLIARSHSAPDSPWPAVPLVAGHARSQGLAVYTIAGRELWLQVAQPLEDFQQARLTAALAAGGTVMLLGLLASGLMGWSVLQELRPLRDFTQAIGKIGPGTATIEAPAQPRQELLPAYRSLTDLLQRLETKLRSERAFAAHAAHSLRTPLAGLSAQLELASMAASPERSHRLALAMDSTRRLARVVDALLTMARASATTDYGPFDATELAAIAVGPHLVVDTSSLTTAGPLSGDADQLTVAVANLIDNAARHGSQHVQIRCGSNADRQFIEVEDDGPGVPPSKLQQIEAALEHFDSRGVIDPVLGLGLTLAASVARAHRGKLQVASPVASGRGFLARLSWPAAAATTSLLPQAAGAVG